FFIDEMPDQMICHRTTELLVIDDCYCATIVTRNVVTDTDGSQLDAGAVFDFLDHVPQMTLKIVSGVYRKRRVVDRGTVGYHHHDLSLLRPTDHPLVGPHQRFAVNVLLEQALAHHQAEAASCTTPWFVCRFVDNVP